MATSYLISTQRIKRRQKVRELYDELMGKGNTSHAIAVASIAQRLKVSASTIYHDLSETRKAEESNV